MNRNGISVYKEIEIVIMMIEMSGDCAKVIESSMNNLNFKQLSFSLSLSRSTLTDHSILKGGI